MTNPTECSTHTSMNSRLGMCEVCGDRVAKYTCPNCEVKTCSLPCVNIHKKELSCDGQRNRAKYVPLQKFTNMDLQNDYILLEEAGRFVKTMSKEFRWYSDKKSNSMRIMKLKTATRLRGVMLDVLPQKFLRHKENTTYLNWKTGELFWKIQWIFPEADNYTVSDSKVLDSSILSTVLQKYLSKDISYDSKRLSVYHDIERDHLKILLKAERTVGNKFYEMDPENTIASNLRGKLILENPVFYVIFLENLKNYEIELKVPELLHKDKYFKKINGNKNFLFSTTEENDQQTTHN